MNNRFFILSKDKESEKREFSSLFEALENTSGNEQILVIRDFRGIGEFDVSGLSEVSEETDIKIYSGRGSLFLSRLILPLPGLLSYNPGVIFIRPGVIRDFQKHTGALPFKNGEDPALMIIRLIIFKASAAHIRYPDAADFKNIRYIDLFRLLKERKRILRSTPLKKTLHIINIPWYSGLAAYAYDISRYMSKEGVRFSIAANSGSTLEKRLSEGSEFIPLKGRKGLSPFISVIKIRRFSRYYDAVFAHTGSSLFIGRAAFLFRKIPLIRVRAERGEMKKSFFNRILHLSLKAVIVPNKTSASGALHPPEGLFHLPPVVDTALFRSAPLRDEPVIGILGRLDPVKGHRELIKSLTLLCEEIPSARLIIIGSEANITKNELRSYAENLGVLDNMEFREPGSYEEIPEIISKCRIGIIPSLGSEALSRVALEWAASARPLITGVAGSLPEFIEETGCGYALDPGDTQMLSSRILELLSSDKRAKEMGRAGLDAVNRLYSPEVYRTRIRELKKKILGDI